jgi:hypothetical protein
LNATKRTGRTTRTLLLVELKRDLERLDAWVRRKLRALAWRPWKTPESRAENSADAA